jgi:hypothetical protein
MTVSESTPETSTRETGFGPRLRFFLAAIGIGSAMGAATTWYVYNPL